MSIDITSLTNTTSKSGTSSSSTASDTIMGKEEFLTLLVAQLKNQDPLNPDEGTEFTAQLAQFSSLEQLMTINKSIGSMVTSTTNSDNIALLNSIGKDVVYYDDTFKFAGEPVELGYLTGENAQSVTLDIQLDGQTIATLEGTELSKGSHTLKWDGLTSSGTAAPLGTYKIVVTATGSDGKTISAAPIVKAEVTGVNLDPLSGSSLNTTLGDIESYGHILGIYERKSS